MIPDIPEMVTPSLGSSVAFVAVIAFVSIAIAAGIWRGGPTGEPVDTKRRWGILAASCMLVWLAIGAVIPLTGILETKMLPPPPMFLVAASFLLAVFIAFSRTGLRLARLPLAALVGFHAFRLPLELILHNWYRGGTLPVQMTYEGHNFDLQLASSKSLLRRKRRSGSCLASDNACSKASFASLCLPSFLKNSPRAECAR